MKLEMTAKGMNTAQAKTEDGSVINFTKTNSSWYDWSIGSKRVGDAFDVPNEAIKLSDKGRYFIERLNADKYLQVLDIEAKHTQIDLLRKRMERESAL